MTRSRATAVSRATIGLLLAAGLAAPGCVMPDQLAEVQKDVADVQQEVRRVQREQDDALTRLREQAEQDADDAAPVTRAELADVMLRLEELSRSLSVGDEQLRDINRRIDRLSQDVQQARALASRTRLAEGSSEDEDDMLTASGSDELPGTVLPLSDAVPDPESLYNTAYADFSKGNFTLAVSGFEEYQQRFPESALADNALYWVGECHFSQGDYGVAVRAFDRLLELYSRSDKAAAANFKKALAFLEQNQIRQGIVQLRYVVGSYPGTDEARLARDKLAGLGAGLE